MNRAYKIVFFGTPEFAVPTLEALHQNAQDVALVVTQPDRPRGRGCRVEPPPVKIAAQTFGCEVVQPESVKTPEFIDHITGLAPDFFVVVAFGHILPKALLQIPRLGAVNIHASLLPKYRGAAPIQRAVINGEQETGITTMLMDAGMDTGDLLLVKKTPIFQQDTAQTLHDRLSLMGAELIMDTLDGLAARTLRPVAQDDSQATYAPMLKKADGRIDWRRPAKSIDALIRGTAPWPGAYTTCEDRTFKIFKAIPLPDKTDAAPGTIIKSFPGELRVATGDGVISILEIQSQSGKRMPIEDFLRGCRLAAGQCFS